MGTYTLLYWGHAGTNTNKKCWSGDLTHYYTHTNKKCWSGDLTHYFTHTNKKCWSGDLTHYFPIPIKSAEVGTYTLLYWGHAGTNTNKKWWSGDLTNFLTLRNMQLCILIEKESSKITKLTLTATLIKSKKTQSACATWMLPRCTFIQTFIHVALILCKKLTSFKLHNLETRVEQVCHSQHLLHWCYFSSQDAPMYQLTSM